ncbi:MAG TPA: hypothetical protein VG324_27605 [Blastocatellia bacterium]|nr:hypothetical protein [Blastocatellia bacterium]
MVHPYRSTIAMLSLSVFCFYSSIHSNLASAQDKKLTPEELIARHLDSIGTAEARSKASTRVASGETKFIARLGGSANVDGDGMMVSSGAKLRFGIRLPLNDYPGEDMAFDGARAATGLLPQGRRSHLSAFLSSQSLPLKEGLIGGTLSTAWPLLRLDQTQPKLDYRGLKKVDGRQLHEVGYRPRKGAGDLKVSLFFDPETFRHVRTRYSFEVGASIGTRENSNMNTESYYSLTEDFDDFRAIEGLTLPHKYKLQLSVQGNSAAVVVGAPPAVQGLPNNPASLLNDWTVTIKKIEHNTKIDDPIFIIK